MPKIERREAIGGSERWPWPAGMHSVLRQVLARRPIASPEELALGLKHLTPVGGFDALGAGVELLLRHRRGRIVIVGDFDADGATSSALGFLTLRSLGFADVDYFIPDRFELGYGLTPEVVERTRGLAPSLIVTVDNGITSVAGVEAARDSGIDVLITDHHLPPAQLPRANVIVNPNVRGHGYRDGLGCRHLAGVGVVFYLLAALGKALGRANAVLEHIDLVALGTVADLVRLDRSNRILVDQGLRRMRAGRCRPGLAALAQVAGAALRDVTAATLGYQIGPRLNAAGRLDDMSVGVRCLVTDDPDEARELAARLDGLNRERRQLESRMRGEAVELVDEAESLEGEALPNVVCLAHERWHEGLVGLVASRIRERYFRPTFAFAPADGGRLKGSGRSIPGFHLRDALADVAAEVPGLIERFGGHAMAAGLTLKEGGFEAFRRAIEAVGARRLDAAAFAETILTDGEIDCRDMTVEVAALLRDAGPWGQGFPEPCFDGRFELLRTRILKDAHVKMTLKPAGGAAPVEAIAFNRADEPPEPGAELTLVYRLDVNDYFETPRVQLIVDHVE
ncbi:MAG: single-stranded-DNA-specific exonuclease RecJ [Gammaproteobacteria bacterium]|nr:single-stranded-DNA-specific exonuclease RecJ [Gammaproteobacteria bacterium]